MRYAKLVGTDLHIRDPAKARTDVYSWTILDPDPEIGSPALRLTKADGSNYDLIRRPWGWDCECPDFKHRREGKDKDGCKHIRACRAVGLLKEEARR